METLMGHTVVWAEDAAGLACYWNGRTTFREFRGAREVYAWTTMDAPEDKAAAMECALRHYQQEAKQNAA
jgi:hypothetical protein